MPTDFEDVDMILTYILKSLVQSVHSLKTKIVTKIGAE